MTRSSGSCVRRSRPALALPSVLRRLRRALRGLPSSSLVRSCDRPAILSCGSAFFRVPAGSPCPPPRAPLLGFQPPSLHAFSAQRLGTFAARGVPPEVVSSCADRLPTSPPEGLACRRRWTLARHLSCAFVPAAEVACAWRSRVSFAVGGRFLFRGRDPLPRFLVRRRTARRRRHYARRDRVASGSHVVHSCRHARLRRIVARLRARSARLQKFFPRPSTACGKRAPPRAMTRTRARRSRAKPRPTPLSAIQSRPRPLARGLRDRHRRKPACDARLRDRAPASPRRADGQPRHAAGRARAIGLIVPLCRFPSTRSCRAPRK